MSRGELAQTRLVQTLLATVRCEVVRSGRLWAVWTVDKCTEAGGNEAQLPRSLADLVGNKRKVNLPAVDFHSHWFEFLNFLLFSHDTSPEQIITFNNRR